MFTLLLKKRTFLETFSFISLFIASYLWFYPFKNNDILYFSILIINFLSIIVNILIIQEIAILKDHSIGHVVFLTLLFPFIPQLLHLESAIAFLLLSVVYYLLFFSYHVKNIFFLIGCLSTILVFLDYYTLPLIIVPFFLSFYRNKISKKQPWEFLLGIFVTVLVALQVLYLWDKTSQVKHYFCSFSFHYPVVSYKCLGLIPLILLLIYSYFDFLTNSFKASFHKKQTNKLYYLFLLVSFIPCLVFLKDFTSLIYFATLPMCIVLSRFIQYIPKKWVFNGVFIILILSMLGFKFYDLIQVNL